MMKNRSQFQITGGIALIDGRAAYCTNYDLRVANNAYTNNNKTNPQFPVPGS